MVSLKPFSKDQSGAHFKSSPVFRMSATNDRSFICLSVATNSGKILLSVKVRSAPTISLILVVFPLFCDIMI